MGILHACTIGDGASIGAMAQVLDGASVGAGAVVEPAAMVSPGKSVPAGEVWGGVPAAFIRKVSAPRAGPSSKPTRPKPMMLRLATLITAPTMWVCTKCNQEDERVLCCETVQHGLDKTL